MFSFAVFAKEGNTVSSSIQKQLLRKNYLSEVESSTKSYVNPHTKKVVKLKYHLKVNESIFDIYEKDKFIKMYESVNSVLVWKEYWEDGFFYLINLKSGEKLKLYCRPNFSKDMKFFFCNSGDLISESSPLAFDIYSKAESFYKRVYTNATKQDSKTKFFNAEFEVSSPKWASTKKIIFDKKYFTGAQIKEEAGKVLSYTKGKWILK